jgi:GWxTD domain-containing protein
MKAIRFVVLLLSVVVVVTSVSAAPPGELKDWENSPQGYFMTRAEHQEWAAVRTDEEARHFVDQFLAKRGPNFAADAASRAQRADKHLTIGKLSGSKTLRGKLVILLGAPSGLDLSDVMDDSTAHRDSPDVANAYAGAGTGSGDSSRDAGGTYDGNQAGRSMGGPSMTRLYHFTYASTASGKLDVTIAADTNTGRDRARDRENSKKLDAAFEAAAQASIKTK